MTTTNVRSSRRPWIGPALLALVLAAAVVAGVSVPVGLALLGATAAALVLPRVRHPAECVVGLYWITYCVYTTILFDVTIRFFFYPFYATFLLAALVGLGRQGLRVLPTPLYLYAAFLFVAMTSFVGFGGSVDSDVIQRILTYGMGLLVLLQVRSRSGLRPIFASAALASLAVAVWVILNAVEGGFRYRGDIDVNENVVAFLVGLGLVVCLGQLVARRRIGGSWLVSLLTLGALGTMLYAVFLLASRGVTLSLALAALAAIVHAASRDRRSLRAVVVLLAVGAASMLLPGGQNILERFEPGSETQLATAGSRLPIWEATLSALAASDPPELVFGHGFDSSERVVEERFYMLTSTHNGYLQILYEFGIVGLVVFLALHAHVLVRAWSVDAADGTTIFALLCFLLGTNMTANASDYFLSWATLGLAIALVTHRNDAPSGALPERPA